MQNTWKLLRHTTAYAPVVRGQTNVHAYQAPSDRSKLWKENERVVRLLRFADQPVEAAENLEPPPNE